MYRGFFLFMKKFIIIFLMLFCGCSDTFNSVYSESRNEYPNRIISLGPAVTENIYLLGMYDRLIANTLFCRPSPDGEKKVKIGTVIDANIEKIFYLQPDIVFATSLTKPKTINKLRKLGLRVEIFKQPQNFEQILKEFLRLGKITGTDKKARNLVKDARKKLRDIRKKTKDLDKVKVFFQLGANPLWTVTKDSFVHDFIKYAGGINIASEAKTGLFSREQVISLNPDVIIIITMGIQSDAEKEVWSNYKTLKAAKNNRIHIVDAYKIGSPTPVSMIDGLSEIFRLLHPEKNE